MVSPSTEQPPVTRYRCKACGNREKFQVIHFKKSTAYHHFTVGGELIEIIEERVHADVIEKVTCIWCANGGDVEVMKGPDTT